VLENCFLCLAPPHNQIEDIHASLVSSWTVDGESELSVLASSLSDDTDIEGFESGNINMSGIAGSSGLADQDGQDGQDSRSYSLEDVGSVLGALG
jgi:hypothetical protein